VDTARDTGNRICKPKVGGSIPSPGTNEIKGLTSDKPSFHVAPCCKMFAINSNGLQSLPETPFDMRAT